MMENGTECRLLESEDGNEEGRHLLTRIWEENKLIWRTTLPSILFRLSMFTVVIVTQSFIGHISQLELAAYALVQTILVRFANGILIGMSSATETLCGQAFGAKQHHMLGIYLQRSWIVSTVTATLILPFYIFATPLFKLLGQEEDIADAVQGISLWFIGVIYAFVFSLTTEMYLQAQRKNMFIGFISPLTFILHVLLSWIFVSKFRWGVSGAMCALFLSRWVLVAMLIVYVFGGWCPESWTGFSKEAFHGIISIAKLSISSGVMMCVQIWYNSVLILLAGYTSDAAVNISAFSISLNINAWQYMFCLGFLSSISVRVANKVGKGNVNAAKFTINLTMTFSVAFGILFCLISLIFGRDIPYLFTNNKQVAEAAANLRVPLALSMLLNSIQTILSGVAVGVGSQAKVAVLNICSYYLIGVPIGCVLAFVVKYGIMGIWIGLVSGQVVQAVVLAYITWRIDWSAEVDKSKNRLDQFYSDQGEEANQRSNDT